MDYIKEYCKQNKITQQELAKKAGITFMTLYNIRKKNYKVKFDTLKKLSKAMNTPLQVLLKIA